MEQTQNSIKKMKSALNDLHDATARLLDAWQDLDDEIYTNKESTRFGLLLRIRMKSRHFRKLGTHTKPCLR